MAVEKERVMQKVQQLMRKGQWDKALDQMKALHAEDNDDPMVLLRLGDLFMKAGEKNEAAKSYYRTAGIFARDGYAAKAIATYKMVLRIDPGYKDVETRIDELTKEKAATSRIGLRAAGGVPPARAATPPAADKSAAIELSETPTTGGVIVQGSYSDVDAGEFTPPQESPPQAGERTDTIELSETPDKSGIIVQGSYSDDFAGSWHGDSSPSPEPGSAGVEPHPEKDQAAEAAPPETDTSEPEPPAPQPIPLFSEIPRAELWDLITRMERRTYSEGDTVVSEGEQGDSLYIIKDGGVRVVTSVKGVDVVLAELGERDFFGEVSFLTGRPRTADIVASCQTEVLELTKDELENIVEKYPNIGDTLRMFHENRVSDTLTAFKAVSKGMLG